MRLRGKLFGRKAESSWFRIKSNEVFARHRNVASHWLAATLRPSEHIVLILLIVLILVFGFGGYRMGPGIGYYGGGGLSLVLTVVVILILLKAI